MSRIAAVLVATLFTLPLTGARAELMLYPPAPHYFSPASVSLEFLTGQFSPHQHPDFVRLGSQYGNRNDMYLQQAAYEAFKSMYAAAKQDGVRLEIVSATRHFNAQKAIWEAKWLGKRPTGELQDAQQALPDPVARARKILEYSSMPGSSRHHWGTDMDFNALNNEWFAKGEGKKVYDWLQANAGRFGFCQPYTSKDSERRPYGYNEEKWHWSYIPLAGPYTEQAGQQLHNDMIQGFAGAETASAINIVGHYVLGINPDCRSPESLPHKQN
ncbi:MAG: M15 family metallopeptidase [Thiolinea sp.]